MIKHRQYIILRAASECKPLLGFNSIKDAIYTRYNKAKYSDDIIRAELENLRTGGYVSYNPKDNPNMIWIKIEPLGHSTIEEYPKIVLSSIFKFILKDLLLPIIISLITSILVFRYNGGPT